MSWYIIAQTNMSEEEFNKKLKDIIRANKFFLKLFKEDGVDINKIDQNLTFKIVDLDGKYAQSDSKKIYLDRKLFRDNNFFNEKLHFVVHELTHWLTRQKEKDFYYADPEEIKSFSMGMAFELLRGKSTDEVKSIFYPIIEVHFEDKVEAELFFKALFTKAKVEISKM